MRVTMIRHEVDEVRNKVICTVQSKCLRFGIEGRQNNMIEKYVRSPSALYKLLDLNREVDTDKSRIQSSLTYNYPKDWISKQFIGQF